MRQTIHPAPLFLEAIAKSLFDYAYNVLFFVRVSAQRCYHGSTTISQKMSPTDQLIAEFKAKKWSSKPFERMAEIIRGEPDQVLPFVRSVLNELPDSGTFLDASLSFLPLADWPDVVNLSVSMLNRSTKHESAESVIAYASLQFPESLHPWLDQLLDFSPNSGAYYETWPWRGSGRLHLERLEEVITSHPEPEFRRKAWQRGFETRHEEVLRRMLALESCIDLNHHLRRTRISTELTVNDYLRIVSFELDGDSFRPLSDPAGFHLAFPAGYVEEDRAWLKPIEHPTWTFVSVPGNVEVQFGGIGGGKCAHCGGRLHNLMSSSRFPRVEHVFEGGPLCLETCLSCLGWETDIIYCEHGNDGSAKMLNLADKTGEPQFPAVPLAECTVSLIQTPKRWQNQDWALSNSRENLHRFGGEPCWIQNADYPNCPKCKETMPFLSQLDSDLPTSDGGEWLWGSGGICYMFWCSECRVSAAFWQCT